MLEYYSRIISSVAGVSPLHEMSMMIESTYVSLERTASSIQSPCLVLALFPVTVLVSGVVALVLMSKK